MCELKTAHDWQAEKEVNHMILAFVFLCVCVFVQLIGNNIKYQHVASTLYVESSYMCFVHITRVAINILATNISEEPDK